MQIQKPYTNKQYADLAVYCNQNNCHIEDKGEYLESVENPGPTKEELQQTIRSIRNRYLSDTDKYLIADYPITDEQREKYKAYRQYLRDFAAGKNWWKKEPLTFEGWSQANAG